MTWLKERAPGLHHFLTRHDSPYPFVRDVAIGGLVLLLVLSSLWMYTGRWGHSPVVVVESGSMMHCSNGFVPLGRDCDSSRYGRLGTIDPGDLILVRDVDGPGDLATFADGGQERSGAPGDVVVYQPNGAPGVTPVIHRAMFHIVAEADGTYSFPELGLSHRSSLDPDDLGLDRADYRIGPGCQEVAWAHSVRSGGGGLITKGDNNDCFDQAQSGLGYQPVQDEWILGKARGEIPWLGLVKLLFTDLLRSLGGTGGPANFHNAPGDCKVMLGIVLAVLVGGPYTYEKIKHKREREKDGSPGP